jgi:uncharacterized membrane protein
MDDRNVPGGPFGPGGLYPTHNVLGPALFVERLVFPLICLLVIVLVGILVYRLLSKSPGGWSGHNTAALRELEMRYARGEISREEFLQRRSDLSSPTLHPPASALPPASSPPTPPPPAPPATPPPSSPATTPPPPPQDPSEKPA